MKTPVADEVLSDMTFYNVLLKHRCQYIRMKGIDYKKMNMENLNFIPPPDKMNFFRKDYEIMQTEMIYDDGAPDFDTMIEQLRILNNRFSK
jgi:hypothetical protein